MLCVCSRLSFVVPYKLHLNRQVPFLFPAHAEKHTTQNKLAAIPVRTLLQTSFCQVYTIEVSGGAVIAGWPQSLLSESWDVWKSPAVRLLLPAPRCWHVPSPSFHGGNRQTDRQLLLPSSHALCSPTSSQVVSDGLGEEPRAVLSLTVGNPPRTLAKTRAIHTSSIFRRLLFPYIDNSNWIFWDSFFFFLSFIDFPCFSKYLVGL